MKTKNHTHERWVRWNKRGRVRGNFVRILYENSLVRERFGN